ncbi:MAG TPA: 1,2-phenylacetyl-CoA epoxidase subunit PaaC [bacterium]|nr:1,2-phenylacetyl-CoA epoxidase subunit PaaC [bacterium]
MSVAQSLKAQRPEVREALASYLLAVADDELILGHRHSEWTGLAPDIESDVALSSVAQEEIGHARLFYERATELLGGSPDLLAYGRDSGAFRNAVLVERPNGDWAFTIVRMFLYDQADAVRLDALAGGQLAVVADLARAIRREEKYHLLYGEQWLRRLSAATPQSRDHVQAALDEAWPLAQGLFEPVEGAQALVPEVMGMPVEAQQERWRSQVTAVLAAAGLRLPAGGAAQKAPPAGRRGSHTDDLRALLEEMTAVRRADPEATW